MAARPLAKLPTFSPRGRDVHRVDPWARHRSRRQVGGACLLGDSIHTVKPYSGWA